MAEPSQLPSSRSGVSDLLEIAARLFRATLLKCLPLAMLAMLLAMLPTLYLQVTGYPADGTLPEDPRYWLLYALGMCGSLLFSSALILRLQALRAGSVTRLADDLRRALPRWPTVLIASLLGATLVMVGLLALLLPGIYVAVCLTPLTAVALLEPVNAIGALRRSFVLVRTMWVKTFACIVIGGLVVAVCVFTALLVLSLLAGMLGGSGDAAVRAVMTGGMLVALAGATAFFSALCLTIYSAASSSA